ncbi:Phenoloxidase subunit 1 [Orchesella cincta]|uniref:Phenoloxidase subunit 1 n=1 Tax=Orchesella cincta TaxID=48709 RepID=A0A1D2MU00_ORCCI|nr:Phenoloxidase subunit 1 [Orchesella cincta]
MRALPNMDYTDEIRFVCMLERIGEPLYLSPRGHGATKYLYNLPAEYLQPHETQAMVELRKLIPPATTIVEVPVFKPSVPYDLKPIQELVPRKSVFSEFNEKHLNAADDLTRILMGQPTRTDFFNACALCRDQVNPHLWVHSFIKSALKRPDMRGFRLPAAWEIMPDMFIEAKAWQEAIEQSIIPAQERAIIVVDKNFSGSDLNPNHKLAYFMEDIGINSHHWHWHIVNAFNSPKGTVDRKGEIFYYMHHGMLARYDAERLANGLNRVTHFDIHSDVIEEACFPKLTLQNAKINMAGRQENSVIRGFFRPKDPASNMRHEILSIIRSWADRVIEAIDAGFAIQEGGGRIDLRTEKGIDVVTAMWESSFDSPNINYYGVLHNFGHTSIGLLHDPDFRNRQAQCFLQELPYGILYCFRWHKYLDYFSQRQKDYLKPYNENLLWNGIVVNQVQVVRGEDIRLPISLNRINNLVTHWMQSDIELSRGLDFGRTNLNGLGSVWVRTTHLQHLPFTYGIQVTNQTRTDVQATVRIFMAPKLDENGDKFSFFVQRHLFFEMDKFTTTLHPGENIITQKSENSSLTVPWGQTFREIERDTTNLTRTQAMCSCGWPEHLLLPKGRADGMLFDLFVMLTNTQIDQVVSSKRQLGTLTPKGTCRDSISYCGMIDDKFPDSRPMGYPFDRPAVADESSKINMFLDEFVAPVSNMASTEIKIYNIDKTIVRGNGAQENARKIYVTP